MALHDALKFAMTTWTKVWPLSTANLRSPDVVIPGVSTTSVSARSKRFCMLIV